MLNNNADRWATTSADDALFLFWLLCVCILILLVQALSNFLRVLLVLTETRMLVEPETKLPFKTLTPWVNVALLTDCHCMACATFNLGYPLTWSREVGYQDRHNLPMVSQIDEWSLSHAASFIHDNLLLWAKLSFNKNVLLLWSRNSRTDWVNSLQPVFSNVLNVFGQVRKMLLRLAHVFFSCLMVTALFTHLFRGIWVWLKVRLTDSKFSVITLTHRKHSVLLVNKYTVMQTPINRL